MLTPSAPYNVNILCFIAGTSGLALKTEVVQYIHKFPEGEVSTADLCI